MSLDRIAAIVNPVAGKGKCVRLWPQIERHLHELHLAPEVHFTQAKGDATQLAAQACDRGIKHILAVGGDGTLNEVINGLADQPAATVGVIPAGSGNDFVRTLGLKPDDWRGACRLIAAGQTQPIDLGTVNGCHFINVAGVGFDAAVANCANVWAKQRFPGSLAYIAALLRVLAEFQPTSVDIEMDDRMFHGKAWLVAVANAQYLGGGMWVAPNASTNDGLFDVCILGELSKGRLLQAFPSVFSGKHLSHPAIHLYRSSRIRVTAASPLLVQADGELIGRTPISFGIKPHCLQVYSQATRHKPALLAKE